MNAQAPGSHGDTPFDELHRLFVEQHEGRLDAAGSERLERLVCDEPTARRAYALLMLETVSLRAWASMDEGEADRLVPDDVEPADSTRNWRRRVYDWIARPTPLSAVVAGLFLTIVVLSLALVTMPAGSDQPAVPVVDRAQFVARIVRSHEAQWSPTSQVTAEGVFDLSRGQRLELLSGKAEIRFDRGAAVVIEAPATLTLDGENACSLLRGRLDAQVPPRAAGFELATRHATIIDLGTEFGIHVGPQAETDIGCYEGSIEIHLPAVAGGEGRFQLAAGESLEVASDGGSAKRHGEMIASLAGRVSLGPPPPEVIASIDFSELVPRGHMAEGVKWQVVDIEPPPSPIVYAATDCIADPKRPIPLFDSHPSRGYLVPKWNLVDDGPWSLSIPLTPTGARPIAIRSVRIEYCKFDRDGLRQGALRDAALTFRLVEPSNGNELASTHYLLKQRQGECEAVFGVPIVLDRPLALVLCAEGPQRGTHLGLRSIAILGVVHDQGDHSNR